MDQALMDRFPAIHYLEQHAAKRIPFFAWEYLASGTGADQGVQRNLDALARITLMQEFLKGDIEPNLSTELFGIQFNAPFGIAPVGLTGLMWPGAEIALAHAAARYRIPFGLSTVATETPETIGPLAKGMGWFQLYPPRDKSVRRDLLARAEASGMSALLVTCDVPSGSRRERQVRAEVSVPPKRTIKTYLRAAIRPSWSLATLQHGLPRFRTLEKYANTQDMQQLSAFMAEQFHGSLSWEYLAETREEWRGPLVLKGVLSAEDARRAVDLGVDAIWVSNHGARQFDGCVAAIDALPTIVDAVGDRCRILYDSGVRSGLDICRALALGADFVLLGRAFIFAVAALGTRGAAHAIDILLADLNTNLIQLGCRDLSELSSRVMR